MKFENGLPFFGDADGPAPAMSEIDVVQCGVEAVNAFLQEGQEILGLALRDVDVCQLSPVAGENQAAAEDHAIAEEPTPEIREIDRIKGLAFAQANFRENGSAERF